MNALDRPTLEELCDRLQELARDAEVGVVMLTGSGEKAFVAGADIKYMSGLTVEEATAWGELGHQVTQLLETMPQPTIAAIQGFALGGGCELALACDLRYASPGAKLGQPEINLGIIPGWGGTQRLARVCGLGVAKDLIFTGRLVDAEEALRIGLVNARARPRAREGARGRRAARLEEPGRARRGQARDEPRAPGRPRPRTCSARPTSSASSSRAPTRRRA